MALEKIPKFDEVKEWAQNQGWITSDEAPVQSVVGETGDVDVNSENWDGPTLKVDGETIESEINFKTE